MSGRRCPPPGNPAEPGVRPPERAPALATVCSSAACGTVLRLRAGRGWRWEPHLVGPSAHPMISHGWTAARWPKRPAHDVRSGGRMTGANSAPLGRRRRAAVDPGRQGCTPGAAVPVRRSLPTPRRLLFGARPCCSAATPTIGRKPDVSAISNRAGDRFWMPS